MAGSASNTDTRRAATVGMFDGVHLGHRLVVDNLCAIAAERGLSPTVFTFDRHPLDIVAPDRSPALLTTPAQRCDMLVDAGAHDVFILVFNQALRNLSAHRFMQMLHKSYGVDLLLVGFNHRFGRGGDGSFDQYRLIGLDAGIEVVQAPHLTLNNDSRPASSSQIRAMLAAGDIAAANRMLGHPYALRGRVMHGRGLGHSIGFPTANIKPFMPAQLVPAPGVYAATATLPDGSRYSTMVNIGTNPTVNKDNSALSIEAHIIGFDGDLYGAPVELAFVERLRDEHRFESIDALSRQLEADRLRTLEICHLLNRN